MGTKFTAAKLNSTVDFNYKFVNAAAFLAKFNDGVSLFSEVTGTALSTTFLALAGEDRPLMAANSNETTGEIDELIDVTDFIAFGRFKSYDGDVVALFWNRIWDTFYIVDVVTGDANWVIRAL